MTFPESPAFQVTDFETLSLHTSMIQLLIINILCRQIYVYIHHIYVYILYRYPIVSVSLQIPN